MKRMLLFGFFTITAAMSVLPGISTAGHWVTDHRIDVGFRESPVFTTRIYHDRENIGGSIWIQGGEEIGLSFFRTGPNDDWRPTISIRENGMCQLGFEIGFKLLFWNTQSAIQTALRGIDYSFISRNWIGPNSTGAYFFASRKEVKGISGDRINRYYGGGFIDLGLFRISRLGPFNKIRLSIGREVLFNSEGHFDGIGNDWIVQLRLLTTRGK